MAEIFKMDGRIEIIQGVTTLSTSSDGTTFVGNGFNVVGGATVARFSLTAQMDIRNIVEYPNDGSVSFDYYGLKYIRFLQQGSSNTGYQQHIQLFASLGINNSLTLVFDEDKDLGDTFDTGNIMATSTLAPAHYHVEAGQQTPFSDLYIARLLNEALLSNDEWKFYVTGTTNTLPPLYTPMAIRKAGVWKTLNNGGSIKIRKSDNWTTVNKQPISDSGKPNVGTSRIRKGGVWLQQAKIGDNLDPTYTHTAYAYSADGTDGFTTVYPNLNLEQHTKMLVDENNNLLLGSKGSATATMTYEAVTIPDNSKIVNGVRVTQTKSGQSGWRSPSGENGGSYAVTAGEQITMSMFAKNNASAPVTIALQVGISASSNQSNPAYVRNNIVLPADGKVYYYTSVLTIPAGYNFAWSYVYSLNGTTSADFTFGRLKVEQGSIATPWMPSASEVKTADYPSYIGICKDNLSTQSHNYKDYTWTAI